MVKTICWFSPMSGMASTGTGSRTVFPHLQSNGATATPHPSTISTIAKTTAFLFRQKWIMESIRECRSRPACSCFSTIDLFRSPFSHRAAGSFRILYRVHLIYLLTFQLYGSTWLSAGRRTRKIPFFVYREKVGYFRKRARTVLIGFACATAGCP